MGIDAFGWWEKNGKLKFQRRDVRIYNVDRQEYLFIGQVLYASTTERDWYAKNVYPHAKGRCLEIGLGLGVASKAILANPNVERLLTVEQNEDVIAAFGRPLSRHIILSADINTWVNDVPKNFQLYDFIFVDHYVYDEDLFPSLAILAEKLGLLLKPGGKMVFWIDEHAPEEEKAKLKGLGLEKD